MYMVENVRRYELRFEVEWPKRWREIDRLNLKKIRSDSESITNTNARQIQMRSSMHMISAFLVASWKKYGELPFQPHKA